MDVQTILISFIVAIAVIYAAYKFISLSKERQVENIKQWLVFACLEAEKMLGSKTGQVKLRYVYDLFVSKYKFISCLIPFDTFSKWVDDSLINMRNMISTNEAVRKIVEEGDK